MVIALCGHSWAHTPQPLHISRPDSNQVGFSSTHCVGQKSQQVAHFTADRHAANSRIEIWTYNPHGSTNKKVSYDISEAPVVARDFYEAPVVARDFYFEQVEILYEENLQIESWMTTPFISSVVEEELNIESWMTTPFNTNIDEDRLKVESWMTAPFEADEFIEMESWMSASWI